MMLNPKKRGIAVECVVCGLTKAPRGRSVPLAMANGRCDSDCPGYSQDPKPGSLWPGETEEEFGFEVCDCCGVTIEEG